MAFVDTLTSLSNNLGLSSVATSGSYNDLANKPTLFSGDYTDLDNKPTLFSGSYNDLTNKPTIPDTSNFVTTTSLTETLDTRLAKSLGKIINVDPDSNNVYTINPNLGSMFMLFVSNASTINISNAIDQDFTATGSVISIFVMVPENTTITWPSNIYWANGSAPTLATYNDFKINLITLISPATDEEEPFWLGGCTSFPLPSA